MSNHPLPMHGRLPIAPTHCVEPRVLAVLHRVEVAFGLGASPRSLPPKLAYDTTGSGLAEEITKLPSSYMVRVEQAILHEAAASIADTSRAQTLVELGAGSSDSTGPLLDALRAIGELRHYMPVDISETALTRSAERCHRSHPGLRVTPQVSDYDFHPGLPTERQDGRRMIALLGNAIGTMLPDPRTKLLLRIRASVTSCDTLLLGIDLTHDPATLISAYADPSGLISAFNKNILTVLNTRYGADFSLNAFEHVALWDARREWIEMRLRSRRAQIIELPRMGESITLTEGEELRTHVSAKFRRGSIRNQLTFAGFTLKSWWTDPLNQFAIVLATPGRNPFVWERSN